MGLNAAPPAKPTPTEKMATYERQTAEILLQCALFPSGRDALRAQASTMKALEEVAERGMTPEAQEHAEGALLALSDKEMQATDGEGPKHIMLAYQVRLKLFTPPSVCAAA